MSKKWRKAKEERPAVAKTANDPQVIPAAVDPLAGAAPAVIPPAGAAPAVIPPAGTAPAVIPPAGAAPAGNEPAPAKGIFAKTEAFIRSAWFLGGVVIAIVGGALWGADWYIKHVVDGRFAPLNKKFLDEQLANDSILTISNLCCRGDYTGALGGLEQLKKQLGGNLDGMSAYSRQSICVYTLYASSRRDEFHDLQADEIKKLESCLGRDVCGRSFYDLGLCQLATKQYEGARTSFRSALTSPTLSSECGCGSYSPSRLASWYAFADLVNPNNRSVEEKVTTAWDNMGIAVGSYSAYTPHVRYSLEQIANDKLAKYVMADAGSAQTALTRLIDRMSKKGLVVENGKVIEVSVGDPRLQWKPPMSMSGSARSLDQFNPPESIPPKPGGAPMEPLRPQTEPPPTAPKPGA